MPLNVDIRRYLRTAHHIASENELGFVHFDCPHCGDARRRGWVHVASLAAGCWNNGCPAHPRLAGGVLTWVQLHEGLRSRGAAFDYLSDFYAGAGVRTDDAPATRDVQDWCTLPSGTTSRSSVLGREAYAFGKRQWDIDDATWKHFSLRVCGSGRYSYRIVIPVKHRGAVVTFTTRSFRNATPKYLAATPGVDAARGVGDLLFNLDALPQRGDVLLVEGPGDVFACVRRALTQATPVALFGSALNPARAALLLTAQPRSVTVALDADALAAGATIAASLRAWGIPTRTATWDRGKDPGAGARLVPLHDSLADRLAQYLAAPARR